MAPAVSSRDHVMVEGITFLFREPRRGEIVAFMAEDFAPHIPRGSIFLERVAGLPNEHLRLADGQLFVNGKSVALSNSLGQIVYRPPPGVKTLPFGEITVTEDCYFLLGDNSTNSYDSRFFGTVPRNRIFGRVVFCYWPRSRMGQVK